MRKMNFIMIAVLTSLLFACSKSSDSSGGGGNGSKFPAKIPDSISQKPEQGQALTQEQKSAFVELMLDYAVIGTPELVVPAANETYQDQQNRQKRLNEASPAAKDFAMILQQRCAIQPGTEKVEGQFKNPGDRTVTYRSRNLSGGGCPVTWSVNDVATTTFDSVDEQANKMIVNFESSQVNDFKLVDGNLAEKVRANSVVNNMHVVGRIEYSQAGMNFYAMTDINSTGKTVEGDAVEVKGSGEFLMKGNLQNSKLTVNYNYRNVHYVMSFIQISNQNGQTENHIYLNGEELEPGVVKVNPMRIVLGR